MHLMEPLQVGQVTLKNRVMFPPLTTGYEGKEGILGDQSIHFYKRLAEGGAGYIVIGDVAPVNTISPTPKLHHDGNIPYFKKLAEEVHAFGSKVAIQIFHPEYDVDGLMEFFRKGDMEGGRKKLHHDMANYVQEVTKEQLADILVKYAECAKRAQQAGIDGIEIHGDRLVGSLCSVLMNHRTDEYGGSFENRTRFALQVVKTLKEAVPDMLLEYKLPIISENPQRGRGGLFIDEGIRLAKELEAAGVQMLHVAQANHTGNMGDTIPPMGARTYGFFEEYTKLVKEAVGIPVSTSGRIVTPEFAEAMLAAGSCDMVGIGRGLLADPDWALKAGEGRPEEIRHCIMCNKGCTDSLQNRSFVSCILNAQNGYEYQEPVTPAERPKHVVVVGGGIAGLEAARVAALKGHQVTVLEKESHLGGQLKLAAAPPRKEEVLRALDYYEVMMKKLKIELKLGCEADEDFILACHPDAVIVAAGASNLQLPLSGNDLPQVVSSWDILSGKEMVNGTAAVLGGGFLGAELAEYLAVRGVKVKILEMTDRIAKEESETIRPLIEETFAKYGVEALVNHKALEIHSGGVLCETEGGARTEVACDFVVMAAGSKANPFETKKLEAAGIPCVKVGDCSKTADIGAAVKAAYHAANAID